MYWVNCGESCDSHVTTAISKALLIEAYIHVHVQIGY